MRFVLLALTLFTGIMFAMSTVVGIASGQPIACAEQTVAPSHHHHTGHVMTVADAEGPAHLGLSSCDHNCRFDVSTHTAILPLDTAMVHMLVQWTASRGSDLTDQSGLRRPPESDPGSVDRVPDAPATKIMIGDYE